MIEQPPAFSGLEAGPPDPLAQSFDWILQAAVPQQLRELASSLEAAAEPEREASPRIAMLDAITSELLRVLDRVHLCVVLLDHEKRVLFINCHARGTLSGGGLVMRGTRIAASDRLADLALQDAIDRVAEGGDRVSAQGEFVALPRHERLPLLARVMAVRADEHRAGSAPRTLVVLLDPIRTVAPSASGLRQIFKLTPAEAKLAQHLTLGRTVEDVADLNQTAVGTVRLQLRSLFAKTGTTRQGALIALLARLTVISAQPRDGDGLTPSGAASLQT